MPSEPVLGWRVWQLGPSSNAALLHSVAIDEHVWMRGDNQAKCFKGRWSYTDPKTGAFFREPACPESPGHDCKCGLWALYDLSVCRYRMMTYAGPTLSVGLVFGLIKAWGRIALHGSEGFRAEHASIVSIFSDSPFSGLPRSKSVTEALARVSEVYGVPVLALHEAVDIGFLSEFGLPQDQIQRARFFAANP